MNLEQITLVKETFRLAQPRLDDLAQGFYADLFARHPELRPMFPPDMVAQRAKLIDELASIVDALDHLGDLVARTTDLGARHAGYGVQAEHYEYVGESLRHSLAQVLGDRYDADTDTAWRLAYNLVAETMVHGASRSTSEVVGHARLGGRLRP